MNFCEYKLKNPLIFKNVDKGLKIKKIPVKSPPASNGGKKFST